MTRILNKPIRLKKRGRLLLKGVLHAAMLGYIVVMVWAAVTDNLGADPVKGLIHATGIGALNILLLTLTVSPVATYLSFPTLMTCRRLIGIYAFVYAMLHVMSYISFELQFNWSLIATEIIDRPYITVGFIAWLGLLLLTITSPLFVRRALNKIWQTIHNGVYVILLLVLVHFSWSRKTALQEPLMYWFIAIILLLPRFRQWYKRSVSNGVKP